MVDLEQIQQFLEQLGPASDDVASIAQTGDRSWAVAYDESTVVALEFVPDRNVLVLTIDLGKPADDRRADVYGALLSFNALWRETGGVKTAMADGELFQIYDLVADGLTLGDLRNVLGNFVEKARVFRRFVAGEIAKTGGDIPLGARV